MLARDRLWMFRQSGGQPRSGVEDGRLAPIERFAGLLARLEQHFRSRGPLSTHQLQLF